MSNFEEEMTDALTSYITHNKRLENVMINLKTHSEELRLLHQYVQNTLVLHGYDLDAPEFAETHNITFRRLFNTIEEIGETLIDLGDDIQTTLTVYQKMLEELRKDVNEYKQEYCSR